MMNGPIIPLPPISAVQELKELMSLAGDPEKSKQFLSDVQDLMASISEANLVQAKLLSDCAGASAELDAKKSVLAKQETELALREKAAGEVDASFYLREVAAEKAEKDLVQSKTDLQAHSDSVMSDLASKQKALEKAQKDAQDLKEQSQKIIEEYNNRLAKIKAAVGG